MNIRALVVLGVVGCTSTRQLANVSDLRLRTARHDRGFVVPTIDRWRERIDPNTKLRFHSGVAGWTARLSGGDLYVDAGGAWIDQQVPLSELADVVRISGLSPDAEAQLEETRPRDARLERDDDGWRVSGSMLGGWLGEFEKAVARLDPAGASVVVCGSPCVAATRRQLTGDDALMYSLRIVHSGEPLGTWRVYSKRQGWLPPVHGVALLALLDAGRATRVGWRWHDVDTIEVENISGGKTLGAIIGTAAASVLLVPVGLVLQGVSSSVGHGGAGASSGANAVGAAGNIASRLGAGGAGETAGSWTPELASTPDLGAGRMFSTGSRVRAVARLTLSLDGMVARRGQLIGTGVLARVRFGDVCEIGGGVRFLAAHDTMPVPNGLALATSDDQHGWSRAATGVFQIGAHLPLDAGFRVAIPLGFEASSGGVIEHDLRVTWGLRYTSADGRWFGSVYPAMPSHLRLDGESNGHWSVTSGADFGVSF